MNRCAGMLGVCLLLLPLSAGWAVKDEARFEVASVKPVQGLVRELFTFSSAGPRVVYKAFFLRQLVQEAYGVEPYQVAFAKSAPTEPATMFETVAKAADNTAPTRAGFRPMLQALLAERFHLRVHMGTASVAAYVLTVGKRGPKFKSASGDGELSLHMSARDRLQVLDARNCSMAELAGALRNFTGQPVLNETGLTGSYDLQLRASMGYHADGSEPNEIHILDAVEEQLGLKLRLKNVKMKAVVVDSFSPLTAN